MCLSVNNCCCCFTLTLGTKIISIFCTVSAVATVALFGAAAGTSAELPPARAVFYITMAAVGLVQFLCGCLLICAAYTKSPKLSWPWTAVSWLQAVFLAALCGAGIVLLHYNETPDTTAQMATVIFIYFVYAITLFYFASVVNSRRQQMVVERREKRSRLVRHRVLPNYYIPSR